MWAWIFEHLEWVLGLILTIAWAVTSTVLGFFGRLVYQDRSLQLARVQKLEDLTDEHSQTLLAFQKTLMQIDTTINQDRAAFLASLKAMHDDNNRSNEKVYARINEVADSANKTAGAMDILARASLGGNGNRAR